MTRKIFKNSVIAILFLLHVLTTLGQVESFDKDGYKITRTIKNIDGVKVIISQNKSLSHTDPLCTANIRIFKNNKQIDSLIISDDQFDAVGDKYGLLVYEEMIKNHVIISKFGSYDGKTIIINSKGKKFITIGGICFLDKKNGLLFSIYHSDLSGFSVFDLNTDKELYSITLDPDRARKFYLLDNRYFVTTDQNDSNPEKIWEIVLNTKKLIETNINIKLQAEPLNALTDYKGINISCE